MSRRWLLPDVSGGPAAVGLLVLRVIAGLGLMLHGWSKIQNPFGWMGPNAFGWMGSYARVLGGPLQGLAALSEFGGGLGLVLGLLTPLAALGVAITMLVAIFTVHVAKGDPFVRMGPPPGGSYELAAIYFGAALLLLLGGPGRFSLDYLLFGRGARRD